MADDGAPVAQHHRLGWRLQIRGVDARVELAQATGGGQTALGNDAEAKPFVAAMARVQSWSAAFDYGVPRETLRARLAGCKAFEEDLKSYRLVFPERAA